MSNSDRIQSLVNQILSEEGDTTFYTFANADGKQWIMPKQNIQTAMNLYQPSGIKGKAMKQCFPYLHRMDLVKAKLGVLSNKYKLQKELSNLLSATFEREDIEFALFCGTPSAHQKITIQINSGKTILGYCKVTNKEEIKQIFLHEQKTLATLKKKGIKQIPECLYCGNMMDDIAVFVQNTVKSNNSVVKHNWCAEHWEFLIQLYTLTKQTLPFEQTDFAKSLTALTTHLKHLSLTEIRTISEAREKVKNYYDNKLVEFSVYHADFTPWNMFFEEGKLFVFDFEYARISYPPYLDRFHYFTQCCIFEKRWNAEQIFKAYQSHKREFECYFTNPIIGYLCYLLAVISLYLDRDENECINGGNSNLKIWLSLVAKLNKI